MDNCFLFAQNLDDKGCFCLKLSKEGDLLFAPEHRSFDEIRLMQTNSNTVVIETANHASLLELELPWLADRKARVAIPYALEDKLAQAVEELHFAFDKAHYQNKRYLVAVIDKSRLHFIINLLDEQGIDFETLTLDWFAVPYQKQIMLESTLLVNQEDFKGALSQNLAIPYLKSHPLHQTEIFTDSAKIPELLVHEHQESASLWIAKSLMHSTPMNLCQGSMQHGSTTDWFKKHAIIAGGVFCFWLFSILLVNLIQFYFISQENKLLDKKIEVIYKEFFPQAKQVISPKFRITQLLEQNKTGNQTRFWFLLNQFAKAMNQAEIVTEDIKYQNNTLFVTLVSSDFAKLESLKNNLKKLQLKVKQVQAATKEQQVLATLELM